MMLIASGQEKESHTWSSWGAASIFISDPCSYHRQCVLGWNIAFSLLPVEAPNGAQQSHCPEWRKKSQDQRKQKGKTRRERERGIEG